MRIYSFFSIHLSISLHVSVWILNLWHLVYDSLWPTSSSISGTERQHLKITLLSPSCQCNCNYMILGKLVQFNILNGSAIEGDDFPYWPMIPRVRSPREVVKNYPHDLERVTILDVRVPLVESDQWQLSGCACASPRTNLGASGLVVTHLWIRLAVGRLEKKKPILT